MAIIRGNSRNNRLTGTAEGDVITGLGGADTLAGGEGMDVLYGDDDQLTATFGSGDDRLNGGAERDVLVGGAGDDLLNGGDGDDVLFGGFASQVVNTSRDFQYSFAPFTDGGNDSFDGGAGFDIAILSYDRESGISLDISRPQARTAIAQDGVQVGTISGVEALQFYGGSGDDRVVGGLSGDELVGRAGNDSLYGGEGFDRLEGGSGDDLLDGGGGFDVVSYAQAAAGVTIDLRLIGQAQDTRGDGVDILIAIEQVDGSRFSDRITGSERADFIGAGDGGNDRIDGGAGNDSLSFYRVAGDTVSRSVLQGGDGDDFVTMGAQSGAGDFVTFKGGAGNDTAFVNVAAHERVEMGGGEDRVVIGLGTGDLAIVLGRGVDTIDFAGFYGIPDGSTAAHVLDFDAGDNGDRIDLRALLAAVAPGSAPNTNPFAGGYARLIANGANTEVQVDRDAGGSAFGFATVLIVDDTAPGEFTAFNFGGSAPATGMAIEMLPTTYDHHPIAPDGVIA